MLKFSKKKLTTNVIMKKIIIFLLPYRSVPWKIAITNKRAVVNKLSTASKLGFYR
jgi:hypothetical protein